VLLVPVEGRANSDFIEHKFSQKMRKKQWIVEELLLIVFLEEVGLANSGVEESS